jgi:hypothetical protein
MSAFWIVVICLSGLLVLINALSIVTLLIAIKRKATIDLVNNKFIRKDRVGHLSSQACGGCRTFQQSSERARQHKEFRRAGPCRVLLSVSAAVKQVRFAYARL